MAIAEQFAGLEMDKLIGAPLTAAADASIQLANSTADFINQVGFDNEGKLRTVAFGYHKRSVNEDGTSNLDEMKVAVPMLAIVPIPNLQVDEVNVLFDMEVKQSEKQESSLDLGVSLTGAAKIGPVKISVTGNVSAHQSNTRSSDNSAKYHVDVRATNHGTPEGIARVLDMMAANIAPVLINSTIKDGNGQDLPEKAKLRAERLKTLKQEIAQAETRQNAAAGSYAASLERLKKLAASQQKVYQGIMTRLLNDLEEDEKLADEYSQRMDQINLSWSDFMSRAGDLVALSAKSKTKASANLEKLDAINETGEKTKYTDNETYYNDLASAYEQAVEAKNNEEEIEEELAKKKMKYNNTIAEVEKEA